MSSLPHVPLDVLGAIVFLAMLFGLFLYVRKPFALSCALSPFFAGFLFEHFPYTAKLLSFFPKDVSPDPILIGLFVLLSIFSTFALRQALASVYPANALLKGAEAALLTFLSVGGFFLVLWKTVGVNAVGATLPSLVPFFSLQGILFWWGMATLAVFVFISRE